jgi:acyl-CoA reductase-like NAD-dependent aldehyde dehydrogenase
MTYGHVDEAIDHVNARDHPLGLYYFGEHAAEREHVLGRTLSGGVGVHDVVLHASKDDLPLAASARPEWGHIMDRRVSAASATRGRCFGRLRLISRGLLA